MAAVTALLFSIFQHHCCLMFYMCWLWSHISSLEKISENGEKYMFAMSQTILGVCFYTEQTKKHMRNITLYIPSVICPGFASITCDHYTNITWYPHRYLNSLNVYKVGPKQYFNILFIQKIYISGTIESFLSDDILNKIASMLCQLLLVIPAEAGNVLSWFIYN